MKKKLTKDSFRALRNHAIRLNGDQQRAIRGGGYFEDYGIGYLDGDGNYYWTRTREDNSSTFGGDYWDSISSSGSGSFYYDPNSAYGTSGNPISIDRYNSLAKMDRWNGGYVESLGYVGVYASSVDYGNSIFLVGSWHAYGDYDNPVSKSDLYELVDEGKWHGGFVDGIGYVSDDVTITALISSMSSNSGNFNINDAINHLSDYALSSSSGYCARHVRLALEAGGLSTEGRPIAATDYDSYLLSIGFSVVDTSSYTPQAGDIVVHEAVSGHPYGHIAMYDGDHWISDFTQTDMYGSSAYRNSQDYTILRWNP